ncbi:MAG: prenyltransferase/squalene oxidase repeat-containing protein [Promethearchaeota archaeon]
MEQKSAYPYITKFKKEPFRSFVLIKKRDIGNFYLKNYNKLVEFYRNFKKELINNSNSNLKSVFWFTLLTKYLKEEKKTRRDRIFKLIKKCEIKDYEQIGFKVSPVSLKQPDLYSTYLALGSLKNLGLLKEYFFSEGQSQVKNEIKNFVMSLREGNRFLHCHEKECDICDKISPTRTLFYVMEIFSLLGVDVRNSKDQFRSYITNGKRRGLGLIYKFLCLKYLDLDSEVKEKEIQFLHQFQKKDFGYGFDQADNLNDTFWIVYILNAYSWLLEYNPSGVYLYINSKLNEILSSPETWKTANLIEISKLVILLSLIWEKFIVEIERNLFKELEKEGFINLNQLKTIFGLSGDIEDLISYINLNYNFNLRILNNDIEFKNFIRNLSSGRQEFIKRFYNQVSKKSIVSLSDIFRRYKTLNLENLKLKEDIFPIIRDMVSRNFIKGNIRSKKVFLGKTKYNFYLNYFLEEVIVSDTEINTERIYEEKEKLVDIKNDLFNMSLKLKNIGHQIKEEIESYLLINEVNYASERLKFIIRDAVMEADFLNENIENSFNEILYYHNIQAILGVEIAQWRRIYSALQNELGEVDSYLKGKIQEKETLRKLNILLENLIERLSLIDEDLNRKLDAFKKFFSETLEKEYNEEGLNLTIQQLSKISENFSKYDKVIYNISQQITTTELDIVEKHKKIIDEWISIKGKFETDYKFYNEGFEFFRNSLKRIEIINQKLNNEISELEESTKSKILKNQFQEAFEAIKVKSDILLNEKIAEIKNLQAIVKNEIKEKHKLYLLYKHLQDKLENLESTIIDSIAFQAQSLKEKVTEEKNRIEVKDFDNFVSQEVFKLKTEITNVKSKFDKSQSLKIGNIVKEFDIIQSNFEKANKLFSKKYSSCDKNIINFNEKSKLTILQWEKFKDFFINEISDLKDDYINDIISNRLSEMAIEKNTNNIKLDDLKEDLKISCKVLIKRIKDMIIISKINADLNENEKMILVYTDFYHLDKELRNYLDNHLLKLNRERVGKILALYDSSIRNLTLNTNMLELQNRINELRIFDEVLPKKFYDKVNKLQLNQDREEYLNTKNYFDSVIENARVAIKNIRENLGLFNSVHNFIDQEYNSFNIELKDYYNRFLKKSEDYFSFRDKQEDFNIKNVEFRETTRQIQTSIENEIRKLLNRTPDSKKMIPEIREIFVKKKNEFFEDFNNKLEKVNDKIEMLKNESYREELIDFINACKIKLSQLLGNLERKVEDNIEIKEYKRINVIVHKRAKSIETEIKVIKKTANTRIKEFDRQSKNFGQISKFVLDDFDKFINEYTEILSEKIKSLERLILKSYIDMTIKAVANEYLTIGFLNNELKIKKSNIQDHLLMLISVGELPGKYEPRFGIYYQNPEILDELDETELEVIKSTNFKVNMALRHLKNIAGQYGSIIAFFASILTISYYLFLFSGGNPAVIVLPVMVTLLILTYYMLKRGKDEKIT